MNRTLWKGFGGQVDLQPGLVVRREAFGGLVFDVQNLKMWIVNYTAADALLQCNGTLTGPEIAENIARTYHSETARADVESFLRSLLDGGIAIER